MPEKALRNLKSAIVAAKDNPLYFQRQKPL